MTYDDEDPDPSDWTDDDPTFDSDDDRTWRPHSRLGMASLAMALVASLVLGLAASLARGETRLLATIGLTAAGVIALMGLLLGIGGLCQTQLRRRYAVFGTALNVALLVMAIALYNPPANDHQVPPDPRRPERSTLSWQPPPA